MYFFPGKHLYIYINDTDHTVEINSVYVGCTSKKKLAIETRFLNKKEKLPIVRSEGKGCLYLEYKINGNLYCYERYVPNAIPFMTMEHVVSFKEIVSPQAREGFCK